MNAPIAKIARAADISRRAPSRFVKVAPGRDARPTHSRLRDGIAPVAAKLRLRSWPIGGRTGGTPMITERRLNEVNQMRAAISGHRAMEAPCLIDNGATSSPAG